MKSNGIKKVTPGHMRKRATCFLLVLLLVTALLPATAFAMDQTGLDTAIKAAIADSIAKSGSDQQVPLGSDVTTEGIGIDASDAKITIDGDNGDGGKYNLSYESSESDPENKGRTIYIIGGDVTLINIVVKGWIEVSGGATLTVGAGAEILSDYSAGIHVTDGEVIVKNGGTVHGEGFRGIYGETSAKVTVEGGTVSGIGYGICITGAGTTMDISGGDISGGAALDVNDGADVVISGGTIRSNTNTAMEVDDSNVAISGGTLRGKYGISAQGSSDINISGGTVSGSSIGVYLTPDSDLSATTGSAIQGGDRAFRVEGSCTLDINGADIYNGSSFGALDYAVMTAENGDTVKLSNNFVTNDSDYLIFNALGKEVTVDGSYGGGKYEISGDYVALTITGPGRITLTNITVTGPVRVNGGAELVIGTGAEMNSSSDNTIFVSGGSKLTVSGGAVEASGEYNCAISAEGTSRVLIKGGTVRVTAAGIYIGDNSKLTVSGGNITAAGINGYGIQTGDGAEVEINGGEVYGNTGIEVSGCDTDHTYSYSVPATLSVTGGIIRGNTAVKATSYASSGSAVTASGGTIIGTRSAIAYEDGCTVSVDEAATVQAGVHLEATCGAISLAAGDENNITLTIKDSADGETVDADYSEHIIVSGYSAAPDGTSGRFNAVELTGAATSVGVEFTDGVATVPLTLYNAEQQDISFHIMGEGSPYSGIIITPVPAEAAFLAVTTMPRGPAVNGGLLTAQPVVKIADNYGNTVTSDSSTTITASKRDTGDWTLGGNVTVEAVSGVAAFAGLTATKNTDDAIMAAALDFSAGSLAGTYSSDFTVPVCYTVTFDKNGGNTEANPTTKAAVSGESVGTLPTAPVRSGYAINGWNTAANGSGDEFTAATAVTSDITVYAQWTAEQFNLPVGSTCFFDLSSVTCSAAYVEKNSALPDTGLKWVPFTYAGTVNAYSLDESSNGVLTASSIAAENAGPRSLFIADDVLYTGTSWNELNAADLIFGNNENNYTANGVSYLLRSLSGGSQQLWGEGIWIANTPESNEWDQILNKGNYIHNYDYASWCQDTYDDWYDETVWRAYRASNTGELYNYNADNINAGFRPALEILNTGSLSSNALKTVIYEMGTNGTLGSGNLTSAAVVYTGELTLPEITAANGFHYTGTPEADKLLGWFNGSVFYPVGTVLDSLPSGTVLTAGEISTYTVTYDSNEGDTEASPATKTAISGRNVGTLPTAPTRTGYIFAGWNTALNGSEDTFTAATAVNADITVYAQWITEKFNLPVGSTCYFDLSSVTCSGVSVNTALPDPDLKWVPFTYVGTINAYSLDESSSGVTSASIIAAENADSRSLFLADDSVYVGATWIELNASDLIFGNPENDYTTNGVSYLLRSLSGGSNQHLSGTVTPESNEWDQILNKGSYIHNNYDDKISYWCQDTQGGYEGYRVYRGCYTAVSWQCSYASHGSPGFRPALEILNAGSLSSDALKTVIYQMGTNGTLGSGSLTSAAAVYTGELTLPEITAANGFHYTGAPEAGKILGWFNGSVFYPAETELSSLPSGTVLTAGYGAPTNGGSGGGGSTPPAGTNTKTETKDNTVTITTNTKATVDSSGKAAASVTKDQLNEAVNSAVAEAKKQGAGTAAVVEIKVDAPADSSSVETGIPKDAMDLAARGGTDALKISTPVASISFDTNALSTINNETSGDVKITTAKVDSSSLSEESKQLVGDRPVYNFSVTSGNNTISEFGGNVTVAVPYTPKEGEDTDAIVIYYINAEGKPEAVPGCRYDPVTKTVSFTTDHFSKYAVGYNKVSFSDVKAGAWYENAVDFAAARGIVTGTGNGNYSPDGKLTRGTAPCHADEGLRHRTGCGSFGQFLRCGQYILHRLPGCGQEAWHIRGTREQPICSGEADYPPGDVRAPVQHPEGDRTVAGRDRESKRSINRLQRRGLRRLLGEGRGRRAG